MQRSKKEWLELGMLVLAVCSLGVWEQSARAWAGERNTKAIMDIQAEPTHSVPADLAPLLKDIRKKYDLPALAGAIVTSKGVTALGVTGVRKYGDPTPALMDDQFHLGSDTKSMTATLLGLLVDQGKLRWTSTLAGLLPEWSGVMQPAYRSVTVEQLMAHRSGFSGETALLDKNLMALHRLPGTPREQRALYAEALLKEAPAYAPGSKYVYSNRNYALLGVIVERAFGISWEDVMIQKLFAPLGMKTAGFGSMGTPGKVDQPWQHVVDAQGQHHPIGPGPMSDNPVCIAPAGLAHCSIGDWAKYIQLHLKGEQGEKTLLKPDTLRHLHLPYESERGGEYGGGWIVTKRGWGGGDGTVLTHTGSNTMNYAVVWMAPRRDFAVLIAANQAGGDTPAACDEVAGALIGYHQKQSATLK